WSRRKALRADIGCPDLAAADDEPREPDDQAVVRPRLTNLASRASGSSVSTPPRDGRPVIAPAAVNGSERPARPITSRHKGRLPQRRRPFCFWKERVLTETQRAQSSESRQDSKATCSSRLLCVLCASVASISAAIRARRLVC